MITENSLTKELEIGAKLGAIIQDKDARDNFVSDPKQVLAEVGANPEVTVLADTADTVHLIIPASIDKARVDAGDESYFEELGKLALGSCMYEDMPD